MSEGRSLTRADLRAPRAAAIAGLLFSALLAAIFLILRLATPADPKESGDWLRDYSGHVILALNLIPIAAIAFLWFMGALRDRLADREDRFFATVFMGSGLLFAAMLLIFAAFAHGIVAAFAGWPHPIVDSATFRFARDASYSIANAYMAKMAGVFMMTTSIVAIYTKITPRWLAILGIALAPLLLFVSYRFTWIFLVFPLWVMLISVGILRDALRAVPEQADAPAGD